MIEINLHQIMKTKISRRIALGKMATGAAAASVAANLSQRLRAADAAAGSQIKGRINHSVCKWCYPQVELEDLCHAGKPMGLRSIELLEVKDFPMLQDHGLACAMVSGVPGGITKGLNRLENHDKIVAFFKETAPIVAKAGFKNIICFSGNRDGMPDEQGLENCATGLKRIVSICEKHDVVAAMELLNSKVDHKDYMCDHTLWGVELVKRVGSQHFKLLYDIYHMQIMEGDVIRTIRDNHPLICHYHTGGVPGRHELDETQELQWRSVARAIVDTGFSGYFAHEFVPTRDPLTSLREAVVLCDV
jgi:hydroxypyruvate isomerase